MNGKAASPSVPECPKPVPKAVGLPDLYLLVCSLKARVETLENQFASFSAPPLTKAAKKKANKRANAVEIPVVEPKIQKVCPNPTNQTTKWDEPPDGWKVEAEIWQVTHFSLEGTLVKVNFIDSGKYVPLEFPVHIVTLLGQCVSDPEVLKTFKNRAILLLVHRLARPSVDSTQPGDEKKYLVIKATVKADVRSNDELVKAFLARTLPQKCVTRGYYVTDDSNAIVKLVGEVDGKLREFDLYQGFAKERKLMPSPVKSEFDNSRIYLSISRDVMNNELVYFLTDAWFSADQRSKGVQNIRIPNIEDTVAYIADFTVTAENEITVTIFQNEEHIMFQIPRERVILETEYAKNLRILSSNYKFCYVYMRGAEHDGAVKYRPIVAAVRQSALPGVNAVSLGVKKELPSPSKVEAIELQELHGGEEGELVESNEDLQQPEDDNHSVVLETDRGAFQPIYDLEGVIHWRDQLFKISPSDLWMVNKPLKSFSGLRPCRVKIRIAAIDISNPTKYEFIVSAVDVLPSPEALCKRIRGYAGVLKFDDTSAKKGMVRVQVNGTSYSIEIGKLFLSGKWMENLREVQKYYTNEVTVIFADDEKRIRYAFHPNNPYAKTEQERCIVEVSRGSKIHVLTGPYKGVIFRYADSKVEELGDHCLVDCDIVLTDANTFALDDLNPLEIVCKAAPKVPASHRVILNTALEKSIHSSFEEFFTLNPNLKLPSTTSSETMAVKIRNDLLEKMDAMLKESLSDVIGQGFRQYFPEKAEDLTKSFVDRFFKYAQ